MSSPIKSVVKNLSDRKIRYDLGKQRSITMTPNGTNYDTASIEGDIFSLFRDSREAEVLIQGVIRGVIEVSYIVEDTYKVGFTPDRQMSMVGSLIPQYKRWMNSKQVISPLPDAAENGVLHDVKEQPSDTVESRDSEAAAESDGEAAEEDKQELTQATEEQVTEEQVTEEQVNTENAAEFSVEAQQEESGNDEVAAENKVVEESTAVHEEQEKPAAAEVEQLQEPVKRRSSRKLKAQ